MSFQMELFAVCPVCGALLEYLEELKVLICPKCEIVVEPRS